VPVVQRGVSKLILPLRAVSGPSVDEPLKASRFKNRLQTLPKMDLAISTALEGFASGGLKIAFPAHA